MQSLLKARESLKALLADRRGATAIEYGLIAAGVAIAIIVVIFTVGDEVFNMFNEVSSGLSARGG